LYSLGNFIFDYGSVDQRSLNLYDDGADLYRLAMGAFGESEVPAPPKFDEAKWWEGVIATATFQRGALNSLELRPIDLGVDMPLSQRGTPHLAAGDRAIEILQRLNVLSNDLGTQIRVENGTGFIDIAVNPK